MKHYLISLLLLCLFTAPVMAEEKGTAGGAAPVLRFGVGARAFAMGGAYASVVDDASAVYWNLGGLANLETATFTAMHSELFAGTKYDYLGWATPLQNGTIGLNYLSLATPGIIATDGTEHSASVRVLYLGYGQEINGWRLGITGKYLEESVLESAGGSAGTAWSLDFGVQKDLNRNFKVGLVLQDLIGSKIKWGTGYEEDIPLNYRLGLGYLKDNFLITMETEQALDYSVNHFGLEYSLNEFVKLRTGLRNADLTAGVGLAKGMWGFDYAYCAGDLENTHRLSFTVAFK